MKPRDAAYTQKGTLNIVLSKQVLSLLFPKPLFLPSPVLVDGAFSKQYHCQFPHLRNAVYEIEILYENLNLKRNFYSTCQLSNKEQKVKLLAQKNNPK